MSKRDTARLNRQLRAQGRRICPGCGRNLPLTVEDWYARLRRRDDGTTYEAWSYECQPCTSLATTTDGKRRYATDEDYRARKLEQTTAYAQAHPEVGRGAARRYMRRKRGKKLAAMLEKTSGLERTS